MNTVVARFHHPGRNLDQLESALLQAGVDDAHITGYTIAMTFRTGTEESSIDRAHRLLGQIGATHIKIRRRRLDPAKNGSDSGSRSNPSHPEWTSQEDGASAAAMANFMAKVHMDVFGHP
jgi:hypothetical protein